MAAQAARRAEFNPDRGSFSKFCVDGACSRPQNLEPSALLEVMRGPEHATSPGCYDLNPSFRGLMPYRSKKENGRRG